MRAGWHADWLVPEWPATGVGAVMTTRHGGASRAPFDSLNLRHGIGDAPEHVRHNQRVLAEATGAVPVYLDQVHGATVVRLGAADALPDAPIHQADASVTTEPGVACTVQVADCLPVLFAAPGGRAVAAAHAGWRGLAAGVLEATVRSLCATAACEPRELQVWLGACIGPSRFEVGADVLEAFNPAARGAGEGNADSEARPDAAAAKPVSLPAFMPVAPDKWLADLPRLARQRLQQAGVEAIGGGAWCTASDASRFFSYRRDRITGRMAAAVWIERG